MVSKVRAPLAIMRNAKRSIKAFVLFQIMRPVKVVKMAPGRVHPPGDPDVALSVLMQSYTRTHTKKGGRLITGCRGLSPADSPCTGQNAETRSNGAALGRPMMLFLTPILNMPGAAGFAAQGSLLYCTRGTTQAEDSFQAENCETGSGFREKKQQQSSSDYDVWLLFFLYQCVSFFFHE